MIEYVIASYNELISIIHEEENMDVISGEVEAFLDAVANQGQTSGDRTYFNDQVVELYLPRSCSSEIGM